MSIYKGNNMISGGSIDTHFVRRPAWNQAVAISAADLTAGYKAPADGMIVCTGVMPPIGSDTRRTITVNGIAIVTGEYTSSGVFSYSSTSCPVNEGDLIKSNTNEVWSAETRYFVPFEDSTVSDIEVVTPEYIRNQNILSDWEDITISTNSSSPTVMPYDGFIYSHTGYNVVLYINTTPFTTGDYSNISGSGSCMVAVRKGDRVYIKRDQDKSSIEKVAYYKLRDYTGR